MSNHMLSQCAPIYREPCDVTGLDCPGDNLRTLKNNEMRHFCEYRTQRLVLEAWNRLFGGSP